MITKYVYGGHTDYKESIELVKDLFESYECEIKRLELLSDRLHEELNECRDKVENLEEKLRNTLAEDRR